MNNNKVSAGAHTLAEIVGALGLELSGPAVNKLRGARAENDVVIGEGSRNDRLASMAGSMRARGMPPAAIEAALLATNLESCEPPLPEEEVRGIARSISSYEPGNPNDVVRTLNDAGNANRFAKQWGAAVRYVPELKQWLVWKEPHWQVDTVGATMEMAKQTAFEIYAEGIAADSQVRDMIARHSKTSQQAPRLNAMLELAKSIPTLVVSNTELDADPWLLGVENGTVDLRSGKLLSAQREQYITKVAPVIFDGTAECSLFVQFVSNIMGGDQDLVAYIQRVLGYMVTGSNSEQRLFFLYGTGANGKTTLLNVCKAMLGNELCRQTPVETIMARSNKSGPTPELACLRGTRAVMTTEIDEGSFLSESLVKQMTGGDPVAARHLYGDPLEFVPRFKLFVAGNHKPYIRGGDNGIWRRIDLIPFTTTIAPEAQDPGLGDKLRAELPGILNWVIAGCLQWQERGLDSPTAVLEAVADYKDEMDLIGQWLEVLCDVGPEFTAFGGAAYTGYKTWAENAGLKPLSSPSFGRKLKERFASRRVSGGYEYTGFRQKGVISAIDIRDAKAAIDAKAKAAADAKAKVM